MHDKKYLIIIQRLKSYYFLLKNVSIKLATPKYCLRFKVLFTNMLPKGFLFSRGLEEAFQDVNNILEIR